MTIPEYMTQKELAEILRVSPLTVHRLTKSGKLKAFKVGRSLRYSRADVEAYISGRRKAWGKESLAAQSSREHDDKHDAKRPADRELNAELDKMDDAAEGCELGSSEDEDL